MHADDFYHITVVNEDRVSIANKRPTDRFLLEQVAVQLLPNKFVGKNKTKQNTLILLIHTTYNHNQMKSRL